MTKQKAFRQAAATVGVPSVLIWGFLFFKAGLHIDELPIYLLFALIPACCLIPLLYRRYLKSSEQTQRTKNDYLKSATISGCLALIYLIVAYTDPKPGWHGVLHWTNPVLWAAVAIDNLLRASKAERARYIPNEQ
ncbi:MAG TPA: hypothetical protein VFB79_18270 [Candidatus Angelobacter sp.]|nr:hypothetical protein [Candidatus Angelobacter sp.]